MAARSQFYSVLVLVVIAINQFSAAGADSPSENQPVADKSNWEIKKVRIDYYDVHYDERVSLHRMTVNCSIPDPKLYDVIVRSYRYSYTFDAIDSVEFIGCAVPPKTVSFGTGVPNIKELSFTNLDFNAIEPFTREHFSGLNQLFKLTIRTNTTHQLPDDLFNQIPKLRTFTLEVNHLNLSIAQGLAQLGDVQFGGIRTNLNTDALREHPFIWSVGLVRNHLGRVTKESLAGLWRLTDLDFIDNDIESFDSDAIEHITNLKVLYFIKNRITEYPKGFLSNNKKLERVTFQSENIETFPDGFFSDLPELREIHITCNLSSVPGDLFKDSSNIKRIVLTSNAFTTLPSELFLSQGNVENLDLSKNRLTNLPANIFDSLHSLYTIKLADNRFKSITDAVIRRPANVQTVD